MAERWENMPRATSGVGQESVSVFVTLRELSVLCAMLSCLVITTRRQRATAAVALRAADGRVLL